MLGTRHIETGTNLHMRQRLALTAWDLGRGTAKISGLRANSLRNSIRRKHCFATSTSTSLPNVSRTCRSSLDTKSCVIMCVEWCFVYRFYPTRWSHEKVMPHVENNTLKSHQQQISHHLINRLAKTTTKLRSSTENIIVSERQPNLSESPVLQSQNSQTSRAFIFPGNMTFFGRIDCILNCRGTSLVT